MKETIERLERKRSDLYKKLQEVGDFRRGIISVVYRKCGKKNCACAKEGHPGHGPVHLWNTTIKGKSYAKSLKLGPELQKYLDEIESHKKFVKLCEEIVLVNERICDLRPAPEVKDDQEMAELKKNCRNCSSGSTKRNRTDYESVFGREGGNRFF